MIYAYSTSGKCTDGRRLEHFEGFCENAKGKLSCLLSVYQLKNNFFFAGEGEKAEEMNAKINFVRIN
jgi:hypothetical protein